MLDFAIHTVIYVSIYSLLTLSLNVQYGLTGLVNFGMMLFFALGAYASAMVVFHELNLLLIPVIALAGTVVTAVFVSLPARRMRQEYWALVTFSAQEVFRLVMVNENYIAGGSLGTSGIPRIVAPPWAFMFVMVALVAIAFLIAERLRTSPFGRIARIIREDELLAASLGRDVYSYQLRMMIVGAVMASTAGIAYAHYITFINPDAFMPVETFTIWTMLTLGGTGNNGGAIMGALLLQTLSVSTRFVAQYTDMPGELVANLRIIGFGVLLILLIMFRPEGLLPERKEIFDVGR
jgi:branched-chain amino acid transport system permease protein